MPCQIVCVDGTDKALRGAERLMLISYIGKYILSVLLRGRRLGVDGRIAKRLSVIGITETGM